MRRAITILGMTILGACLNGCAGRYASSADLLSLPTPPSSTAAVSVPDSPADVLSPVSLDDAIALVLNHNPELRAAEQRVFAADAGRVQAHAWDNPKLLVDLEGFGGDRSGFRQTEVTVAVGLPVDIFGQRGTRIRVAEAEVEVTRARFVERRRRLVARARMAFHRVLAAQELLRISLDRLRYTEETAVATSRQVDAGKAPPLQQIRAEVAREAAGARVKSARALVQATSFELAALWGETAVSVEGRLRTATPQLNREQSESDLLANSPRLMEGLWIAERHARDLVRTRRERLPELEPAFGVRWLTETGEQDLVAGLSIGIPVLDRKGAAIRAAERAYEAAKMDAESIRLQLLTELNLALQQLEEASLRFQAFVSEISPRAKESLDLARLGYAGGKFGYLELLDAQNTFIDVESGRADALIAQDQAITRLEGLLSRDLEEAVPNERNKP